MYVMGKKIRCRRILPLAALTVCAISLSIWTINLPALAQTTAKSPEEQATEAMLLEQLTAARNWRAQASVYQAQNKETEAKVLELQKQLDGSAKQISDLKRQVSEARNQAAMAKAVAAEPAEKAKDAEAK